MKISFEYGQGLMDAELPDTTDVFVPGETIPDPPCIPEELLEEKTLESLRNPIQVGGGLDAGADGCLDGGRKHLQELVLGTVFQRVNPFAP